MKSCRFFIVFIFIFLGISTIFAQNDPTSDTWQSDGNGFTSTTGTVGIGISTATNAKFNVYGSESWFDGATGHSVVARYNGAARIWLRAEEASGVLQSLSSRQLKLLNTQGLGITIFNNTGIASFSNGIQLNGSNISNNGNTSVGIFIDDAGRVGINKTPSSAPSRALDVEGFIQSNVTNGSGVVIAQYNGSNRVALEGREWYGVVSSSSSTSLRLENTQGIGMTVQNVSGIVKLDTALIVNGYISKSTLANNGIYLDESGRVGINKIPSSVPSRALDVEGVIQSNVTNGSGVVIAQYNGSNRVALEGREWYGVVSSSSSTSLRLENTHGEGMTIHNSNGDVELDADLTVNGITTIGTTSPDVGAALTVAGKISAQDITIKANAGGADFVFEKDYALPSLEHVEQFVKANKHLPEIPSAQEMQENGVQVSEMQTRLLQKIEELTLYVIELEKENKKQNSEIKKLLNQIEIKN